VNKKKCSIEDRHYINNGNSVMYFSISSFYFGVAHKAKPSALSGQLSAKESTKQAGQDLKTLIIAHSSAFS